MYWFVGCLFVVAVDLLDLMLLVVCVFWVVVYGGFVGGDNLCLLRVSFVLLSGLMMPVGWCAVMWLLW